MKGSWVVRVNMESNKVYGQSEVQVEEDERNVSCANLAVPAYIADEGEPHSNDVVVGEAGRTQLHGVCAPCISC